MKSISQMGLDGAAREAEKRIRQEGATPLGVQLQMKFEPKTRFSQSMRNMVMENSAKLEILAWRCTKLQPPGNPDGSSDLLTFYFTNVSATATKSLKKKLATTLMEDVEIKKTAAISIWTDGTLLRTLEQSYTTIHKRERVAVQWDYGWYTGHILASNSLQKSLFRTSTTTVMPLNTPYEMLSIRKLFSAWMKTEI